MSNEPVVVINPFVVPTGSEARALAAWEAGRDFLRTQAMSPDATYALINVPKWESAEARTC